MTSYVLLVLATALLFGLVAVAVKPDTGQAKCTAVRGLFPLMECGTLIAERQCGPNCYCFQQTRGNGVPRCIRDVSNCGALQGCSSNDDCPSGSVCITSPCVQCNNKCFELCNSP